MKLSELKQSLSKLDKIAFQLPDGTFVPRHFHVTEVGQISKRFIDCGGTLRKEEKVSLQLWNENDYDHRLHPEKLLHILELSEKSLSLEDSEIEVEYQGETIQKFGLELDGDNFILSTKQTDCLAKEKCAIPSVKPKLELADLGASCCSPNSTCC
ncbi:DUF6428 family protein [Namhaeicola litoreus]|uniref:DUF6428 family protein n=1 Tax=Namhaeicola litoreus TaxID=1052145 RepID=A0ABW3XZ78_9FLAO